MFTYLSNGYVLVNASRCIITREECEEIKSKSNLKANQNGQISPFYIVSLINY